MKNFPSLAPSLAPSINPPGSLTPKNEEGRGKKLGTLRGGGLVEGEFSSHLPSFCEKKGGFRCCIPLLLPPPAPHKLTYP